MSRCEACELEAAKMAYAAGLGASEWEAFIDRVPECDECRVVQRIHGHLALARGVVSAMVEESRPTPPATPSLDDKLAVMAHKMTDAELREAIESIRGNPKRAGSRARRLNMGESLALAALMAEEARRVRA